ncbi:hypothetical protein ACXR0O_17415 [Verrucomicrobiota bacterium sgz303538]
MLITLATVVFALHAIDADAARQKIKRLPDRPTLDLPPGQSGPFGGYGSSPNAKYNPQGTGGGASDPGKSTSGGNAGNIGPASNPATGQAGKPESNTGVSGTPSNP